MTIKLYVYSSLLLTALIGIIFCTTSFSQDAFYVAGIQPGQKGSVESHSCTPGIGGQFLYGGRTCTKARLEYHGWPRIISVKAMPVPDGQQFEPVSQQIIFNRAAPPLFGALNISVSLDHPNQDKALAIFGILDNFIAAGLISFGVLYLVRLFLPKH